MLAENRDVGLKRKGDAGERNSCHQLERWLDQLASEIGDLTIKIEGLKSHLENLADSRDKNIRDAAIAAVSAAVGSLGSAARTAAAVKRILSGGKLRQGDLVGAIPYIGAGILTARSALGAYRDSRQIREVIRQLDQLKRMQDAILGTARELENEWQQNCCDRFYS